jgi:hypothetical protein
MYDLEALRQLNEQAHLRAVALANEDRSPSVRVSEETKEVKPPPVFPLSILARKLIGGPPSLAYFVALLEQSETFVGFRELVREYLPEYEVNIMAEDLDRRAWRFSQLFSGKYFPLSEDTLSEEFTIGDLLSRIPMQPIGFSYEGYHRFTEFRKGYILLLSLVECPWDEDPLGMELDEEVYEVPGGRVPILEAVGELVGEGLPRLIPDKGWSAADLHTMTDGTEFEGIGEFADWVFSNTGCYHLDAQGESLDTGESIDWSPEQVDEMTDDWKASCEILDKIHRVALLLEQDSERTFRKLMALLLDKHDLIIPKEQLLLPLD